MAAVLDGFELLEIAALDTANGNGARLAEVVQRTPQVVDEMEIAMNQSLGETGCDWLICGIPTPLFVWRVSASASSWLNTKGLIFHQKLDQPGNR